MLIRDARGGHSAALPVGRAGALDESILEPVAAIIAEVRRRGRDAVLDYTERFDGIRPARLRAPAAALELAWAEQPSAVRVAMDEAIRRVEQGHRAQLPAPRVTEFGPGSTVRQEYRPVARAGLYVPGGKAAYASSVIMNAVPAQVAGVNSIVVACPPARATGLPPAPVLSTVGWESSGGETITASRTMTSSSSLSSSTTLSLSSSARKQRARSFPVRAPAEAAVAPSSQAAAEPAEGLV